MVVHESDQGFGYVSGGQVSGYSHAGQFSPSGMLALPAPGEGDSACDYPHTFEDMVKSGYVAPGADFVVAFDEMGEPIRLPKFRSMGLSGGQGFGKTVTTLLIMLETIAKFNGRVRFLIADPHMYVAGEESLLAKVESLRPFFLSVDEIAQTVGPDDHDYRAALTRLSGLPNPTVGGEELIQWMHVVDLEFDRRTHGKQGNTWVIVMDEFAGIMSSDAAKPVSRILEKLNQQARKMDMFALLISQEWKATRTGGSELRHSIVSFIVHNTPEAIAELIIPRDEAPKAVKLDVGEVLVHDMGKTRQGRVPYTTEADAQRLVELYAPWRPLPMRITEVRQPEPAPEPVLALPETTHAVDVPMEFSEDELADVRDLYVQGLSEVDIAKSVYGVKSGPELAQAKIKVRQQLGWLVTHGGTWG